MAEIRILIVDDHTVVRDGLASMLDREEDFAVVGEAKNGLEAVAMANELHRLMVQRGHADEDGTALARLYRDEPV